MDWEVRLRASTKIGALFLAIEIVALIFVRLAKPEYDGQDLGALIFWIALTHIFLISGGLILLFNLLRWFVDRPNDGI